MILNKLSLYPAQIAACNATVREFGSADRATVSMCCGSGKTLVGCFIANAMYASFVAVLVPTILLAEQVAKVYKNNFCDDVYVINSESPVVIAEVSYDIKLLARSAFIVTYNSAPQFFKQLADVRFDLVVYDEAHKTAGKYSSLFNTTLTGYENIRKRLFMTATPRHASVIEDAAEDEAFYSMNDVAVYGRIVYSYQIREAINDGVICDYKILVACISDEEIKNYLIDKSATESEHKLYALALSLKKAIDEFGLKKVITYHPTIESAKHAAEVFKKVIGTSDVYHVSSHQGNYVRAANFADYKEMPAAIITNARCLNEGMDVPATDAVMFCSEKSSIIDIIQCAGRAMRKADNKSLGYIILPVLSGDNAAEFSDYSDILQVLNALSENDTELHQMIKLSSKRNTDERASLLGRFFVFTDRSFFDIKKLADSIYLKTIYSVNTSFFARLE